jgi:hypothetical protein
MNTKANNLKHVGVAVSVICASARCALSRSCHSQAGFEVARRYSLRRDGMSEVWSAYSG